MGSSQVKFFLFLLFSYVFPKISCQNPTCGNNSFYILYPFHLSQEGQKPHHSHSNQFILKCNSQGLAALNLPFSGDFYVRDIDYFRQKIQLYDPGNCLPGRLMNLSLSPSPFVAVMNQNYTFFSCPTKGLTSSVDFSVISCLSNSTASILAASLVSRADEIKNLTGCKVIVSLQIPVSSAHQYEYNGFNGDLQLAWNDPSCNGDCKGRSAGRSVIGIIIICLITISVAILGALFCIGCCLRFAGMVLEIDEARNQRSHRSTTRSLEMARITLPPHWPRPQPSAPHDEFLFRSSHEVPSTFRSLTEELMIGGSQCISGPNGDSCPICLEEYKASERLRRICKCDHCFHAHCLEKWLEKESTCPVCRTCVDLLVL